MSTDMNQLFNRIKNLKQFTVEIDVPEQMKLDGQFPFDTQIHNGKAYFKVYAATKEEANQKVSEFVYK